MKKKSAASGTFQRFGPLVVGWVLLLGAGYAPLLLHPGLHTACPENDTWNFPIRWSVLSALREGRIPLWNPLSAFGIPWLAAWQTEIFYPGTQLFKWIGLSFWNYSGLLHLLIFSAGIYRFLRLSNVQPIWAFFSAAVALLNGCAYNHLGSNSSMDTMAWMPWIFVATLEILDRKKSGGWKLALFLTLQVFAGYPQIIFYTLAGAFAYSVFRKGWRSLFALTAPLAAGFLFSACQWLPSLEYFFLQCVRLPAVRDNPHFYLPVENLKTFLDFNALGKDGIPDYVLSPTFFYFNLYSGLIPLALLAYGAFRFRVLKPQGRFFLTGLFLSVLWALGFFLKGLETVRVPFPDFLEPAKSWVLVNLWLLLAVGFLLEDLFPRPGRWKWALLLAAIANLVIPVWRHPLERNLLPPNPRLEAEALKLKNRWGQGRALILPDAREHQALYTPLPDGAREPLFKRFIPDSNLLAGLPLANFYGSTWPTWGTFDANLYFQYEFPYEKGTLLDLLGIDLLYLPESSMPSRYQKVLIDGAWNLWKNPASVGSHFIFTGTPVAGTRKEAFTAFASGASKPLKSLFLDPSPVSDAPLSSWPPTRGTEAFVLNTGNQGYFVRTQNAMPGWRAWVDLRPADLYLADGIFQSVPFSAKAKILHLAYQPASFRLGLFLSLLGLVGIGFGRGFRKPRT